MKTRLSLTGPLVVARDIAHAKIKERLDAGEEMPSYLRDHPVYYAGPAKTPAGMASGSFGPTTAGRMDSYVEQFQAAGGSKVMLAKGNRSKQVTEACGTHGGFYLGSIGGPAARLAQDCITSVSVLEYEELGMEAVWKIEVEDFPAFIVVDDKGNDFFTDPSGAVNVPITGARDPGPLGAIGRRSPIRSFPCRLLGSSVRKFRPLRPKRPIHTLGGPRVHSDGSRNLFATGRDANARRRLVRRHERPSRLARRHLRLHRRRPLRRRGPLRLTIRV